MKKILGIIIFAGGGEFNEIGSCEMVTKGSKF